MHLKRSVCGASTNRDGAVHLKFMRLLGPNNYRQKLTAAKIWRFREVATFLCLCLTVLGKKSLPLLFSSRLKNEISWEINSFQIPRFDCKLSECCVDCLRSVSPKTTRSFGAHGRSVQDNCMIPTMVQLYTSTSQTPPDPVFPNFFPPWQIF